MKNDLVGTRLGCLLRCVLFVSFLVTSVVPPSMAQAIQITPSTQTNNVLPLQTQFTPSLLQGLIVDPDKPFEFEFIVGRGDDHLDGAFLEDEGLKHAKYFLTALTVPEQDMWVNLSPYEVDRIIPDQLGQSIMGVELLAQDYLLKRMMASLIYPEHEIGKAFWNRVYQKAFEQYGTTDIPVDTFHKVWIVPDQAAIYEHDNGAFLTDSSLTVMMEQDYVAEQKNRDKVPGASYLNTDSDDLSSEVMRSIVIPELTKEVNEGKHFASLRQIYHAMILATWFKIKLKENVLQSMYVDQNRVGGVNHQDENQVQELYQDYVDAYKLGAFDFIQEHADPMTQEMVPRRYFSGGITPGEQLRERLNRQGRVDNVMMNNDSVRMRFGSHTVQQAEAGRDEAMFVPSDRYATSFDEQREVSYYYNRLNYWIELLRDEYTQESPEKIDDVRQHARILAVAEQVLQFGNGTAGKITPVHQHMIDALNDAEIVQELMTEIRNTHHELIAKYLGMEKMMEVWRYEVSAFRPALAKQYSKIKIKERFYAKGNDDDQTRLSSTEEAFAVLIQGVFMVGLFGLLVSLGVGLLKMTSDYVYQPRYTYEYVEQNNNVQQGDVELVGWASRNQLDHYKPQANGSFVNFQQALTTQQKSSIEFQILEGESYFDGKDGLFFSQIFNTVNGDAYAQNTGMSISVDGPLSQTEKARLRVQVRNVKQGEAIPVSNYLYWVVQDPQIEGLPGAVSIGENGYELVANQDINGVHFLDYTLQRVVDERDYQINFADENVMNTQMENEFNMLEFSESLNVVRQRLGERNSMKDQSPEDINVYVDEVIGQGVLGEFTVYNRFMNTSVPAGLTYMGLFAEVLDNNKKMRSECDLCATQNMIVARYVGIPMVGGLGVSVGNITDENGYVKSSPGHVSNFYFDGEQWRVFEGTAYMENDESNPFRRSLHDELEEQWELKRQQEKAAVASIPGWINNKEYQRVADVLNDSGYSDEARITAFVALAKEGKKDLYVNDYFYRFVLKSGLIYRGILDAVYAIEKEGERFYKSGSVELGLYYLSDSPQSVELFSKMIVNDEVSLWRRTAAMQEMRWTEVEDIQDRLDILTSNVDQWLMLSYNENINIKQYLAFKVRARQLAARLNIEMDSVVFWQQVTQAIFDQTTTKEHIEDKNVDKDNKVIINDPSLMFDLEIKEDDMLTPLGALFDALMRDFGDQQELVIDILEQIAIETEPTHVVALLQGNEVDQQEAEDLIALLTLAQTQHNIRQVEYILYEIQSLLTPEIVRSSLAQQSNVNVNEGAVNIRTSSGLEFSVNPRTLVLPDQRLQDWLETMENIVEDQAPLNLFKKTRQRVLERLNIELNPKDEAQVGGIDLDASRLNLMIESGGDDQAMTSRLAGYMEIDGLEPYLIQMQPVTNIPQLLQLK